MPDCGVINDIPEDGLIAHHHCRHLGGGGTALKPSDYHCIPLCDNHHKAVHHYGIRKYLDTEFILKNIVKYLIEFIEKKENDHESEEK